MKSIRCPRCKNSYQYEGIPPLACPDCTSKTEQEYHLVREYVKEHPGVTIQEVSQNLDVPHSRIIQYLREERLEIARRSMASSFLRCMNCGKVISTGTRCEDCKRRHGY